MYFLSITGSHPDYLTRLQCVEKRKSERVSRAEARWTHTTKSAWLEYNDIKYQAEREFVVRFQPHDKYLLSTLCFVGNFEFSYDNSDPI
jgi:hypothetical protein